MTDVTIFAIVDGQAYRFTRSEPDSRGWLSQSCAKVCPYCLTKWAVLTVEESSNVVRRWHLVEGQICRSCGRGQSIDLLQCVPGSLLEEPRTNCQTCDWDLIDYLPEPLLRREFDLHMLYLDKQETSQDVNTTATTESDDWTDAQRYYDTLRSAERNQSSEPASGS